MVNGMSALLTLPDAWEDVYWRSPTTQQQLVVTDTYGLCMGIICHISGAMLAPNSHHRAALATAALLQVLQLVWLYRHRRSYFKLRMAVTLMQRLRWLMARYLLAIRGSMLQQFLVKNYSQAGIRTFLAATVLSPVMSLISSMNHQLPFRLQLILITAGLGIEASGAWQQSVKVLELSGMEPVAQRICRGATQMLLIPWAFPERNTEELCMRHGATFTVVILTLLLSVLLPLQLVYWHEYSSKSSFMLQVGTAHAHQASHTGAFSTALFCWAWCAIACALTLLYLSVLN